MAHYIPGACVLGLLTLW